MTTFNEQEENRNQLESQMTGFARLGLLAEARERTEFDDILERHIEERLEYEEGSALSIEMEKTVRIVLCTGGPHCEIRWPETGTPTVVCYGWFGSNRAERELTQRERDGVQEMYDIDQLFESNDY